MKGIVLPKAETKEEIMVVDHLLPKGNQKEQSTIRCQMKIVPLIESALGLFHSFEIASASPRVQVLHSESIDFALNIHATLTKKRG